MKLELRSINIKLSTSTLKCVLKYKLYRIHPLDPMPDSKSYILLENVTLDYLYLEKFIIQFSCQSVLNVRQISVKIIFTFHINYSFLHLM